MLFDREEAHDRAGFSRRAVIIGAGQTALLGLLGARLYGLQVIDGESYALLADENRINIRLLAPTRGEVRDRFGRVVATNEPRLRVLVIPENAGDLAETLERVGHLTGLGAEARNAVLARARRQAAFLPLEIADNLSWEQFARLNVHGLHLPGVFTEVGWERRYPPGPLFSHVSGYVGAVNDRELESDGDGVLRLPGFAIGKTGIEKTFDEALRGRAGRVKVEIEASGRVVREIERQRPTNGTEVILTVDHDLQAFALERIAEESGAVVVLDVETGDVLALASSPTFDARLFEGGISSPDWRALTGDRARPLTNRAISGQYPPGSTFKIVTALAALGVEDTDPEETITCRGSVTLGRARFRCWKRGGHGAMNLRDAIKHSCDVYFYRTGERIGIDAIAAMARRLGFGETCRFAGSKPGVVPDDAWKRRNIGEGWYGGETLIAAIGQGYVLATPLQLAVMAARVANGRAKVVPRFARLAGAQQQDPEPEPLGIPSDHIERIRAGMRAVVNEQGGTAHSSHLELAGVEMAGKTGTSQVVSSGYSGPEDRETEDHALFVAYGPADAPAYAIAVVIEHGGGGSRAAAPVARDVMTWLLERRLVERVPYAGTGVQADDGPDEGPPVARG